MIQVVYDGNNFLLILEDAGMVLSREEAEQLFVDLGHALQDHDVIRYDENGDISTQPKGEPYDDNLADRIGLSTD